MRLLSPGAANDLLEELAHSAVQVAIRSRTGMTGRIILTAADGRSVDVTTQIGDLFQWARLGRLSAPEVRPWARQLGIQLHTLLGPEALRGVVQIVETQISYQAAAELTAVWENIRSPGQSVPRFQ